MSHIAVYEQTKGRDTLKIKKYCEDMPVWKSMARSALAGILLYLLIFAVIALAASDWLMSLFDSLGNPLAIVVVAGSMAAFAAAYSAVSDTVFRKRYKNVRSSLAAHRSDRKYLDKIRKEQEINENAG